MADFAPGEHPMRAWGVPDDGDLDRVVVVSPHLDDAVLGCGRLLAALGAPSVVTVFAGNPERYPEPMREWDVQCGFAAGDDVMEARRTEDANALAHVGATPVHLDFVEYTYRPGDRPVPPEEIADGLAPALATLAPSLVIAPFGLANPDHDVVHRACMLVRDRLGEGVTWWCYEDLGYKHIPGMLAWRVSSLFRRGLWPTPVAPVIGADEPKRRALECYPSQLRALEEDWRLSAKVHAPEQCWRLAPPPPGWESLSS